MMWWSAAGLLLQCKQPQPAKTERQQRQAGNWQQCRQNKLLIAASAEQLLFNLQAVGACSF
jgi:hypothetical protein